MDQEADGWDPVAVALVVGADGAVAVAAVVGVVEVVDSTAAAHRAGGEMNIKRLLRHFMVTHWYVRRIFSPQVLDAVAAQVRQCESTHGGEIQVAIEADLATQALLRNQSTRERAIEVFAHLHVWDTRERNGVLVYVCFADRAIEIIADRGFAGKIGDQDWATICTTLQREFARGEYQQSLCNAIQSVSDLMARHFPHVDDNELPDRPVLLS